MARTDIPVQTIPFQGSKTDITLTAGDATNDHEFVNDGATVLFVKKGATGNVAVTVVSVADEYGRTGDETFTVATGKEGVAGPFIQSIWDQSGSVIHVDIDLDTNVELAAMKFTPRK